jgi:hypothetical protein
MSVVSYREVSPVGLSRALRQVRDPLLLLVAPVIFAMFSLRLGYLEAWPLGFDFRGTLWEPARAFIDGAAMYPEPTREAVVLGNPAVYPPVLVLLLLPLALLPVAIASLVWFFVLGACVVVALRLLGVHDWRCHVLAVSSPAVVHGMFYGNLTIALVTLVALAWRFRDHAWVPGIVVGAAVAAKLFVWPLVVWLLLTRRYRAALWSGAAATSLVVGAWALIGFQGFHDYPALLRIVQDVYAVRSVSLATAAAALGAPVSVAVVTAGVCGAAVLGLAARAARRPDGDRRAFVLVVGACIVASPIVWPNYLALLLVPIAITWSRLAPMWWFGYAAWILTVIVPNPSVAADCCVPEGVPPQAWAWSHADPTFWYAAGSVALVGVVVAVTLGARRNRSMSPAATTHRGPPRCSWPRTHSLTPTLTLADRPGWLGHPTRDSHRRVVHASSSGGRGPVGSACRGSSWRESLGSG